MHDCLMQDPTDSISDPVVGIAVALFPVCQVKLLSLQILSGVYWDLAAMLADEEL